MARTFKFSQKIKDLIKQKDVDAVFDSADASCTNGYDNGGSTGSEIFENGFDLARRAGNEDVYFVNHENNTLFFVGTEESILAGLEKLE